MISLETETKQKYKCKRNCFLYSAVTTLKASGLEMCMLGEEEFLFRYGSKWKSHRAKIVLSSNFCNQ